jgi:uncharacterized protein YcfL
MRQLLIILPLLALFGLCGCRTTSSVERQQTAIRDSVVIRDSFSVRDSVRIKDSVLLTTSVRDSVRIKDSTVIVKDTQGNIVSQEHWHDREHMSSVTDSAVIYRMIAEESVETNNRLLEALRDTREQLQRERTTVREPSLTEKLRLVGSGVLLAVIAAVVIFAFTRKRNEISF